jgi:hypothetical protein
MTESVMWRLSPRDHTVHAFRVLGELVSQAICAHCALTQRLTEPGEDNRRCLGCLMIRSPLPHAVPLTTHTALPRHD